jgi:autotransporter-associated beta strand protein
MKIQNINRLAYFICCFCVATGGIPTRVHANSEIWSATAANGAWETGANWVSGNAPGANTGTTSPDVATFKTNSTTLAILPDAGRNIMGITFDTAKCGAYTIGVINGEKLLLSTGGRILMTSTVATNEIVNAPLEVQGDGGTYTFTNASAKALTFGGLITGAATSGNTNALLLAGSGGGTISSNISDGAHSGLLTLVKSGSSGWSLYGSNTFSGGITFNTGSLMVGHNAALGTGPVVINGGTLYTTTARTLTTDNAFILNGNFTAGNYGSAKNLNVGRGSVYLSTNVTITSGGDGYGSTSFTFGGPISDDGNNRTLTLVGGNGNSSALLLEGTNTFTGGLILNSGVLRLRSGYALGTGTFRINGGSVGGASTGAGVSLSSNNIPLIFGGNFATISAAGDVDLGRGPVSLTGSRSISISNSGLLVGGAITNSGGVNFGLTITIGDYNGNITLNGTNTFDGGLTFRPGGGNGGGGAATLNIGFLGVDSTASAIGTGTLTLGPLGTATYKNFLQIDNTSGTNGTLATSNAQKWECGFTFKGSKSLDMGTGPVSLNTNVTVTVLANVLKISGAISDGLDTARKLTKAGLGTLVLSSANTYSGGTSVTNGTLTVESTGTLGSGNVLIGTNSTLRLLTSTAISNTATVQLVTVGSKYGKAYLTNGVLDVVSGVIIDNTLYNTPGTYGSTASGATYKFDNQFEGEGLLRIVANPGTIIRFL